MRRFFLQGFVVVGIALFVAGCGHLATGEMSQADNPKGYQQADIKLGGQLYDKWAKFSDVKVSGSHPLYPAASKKQGGNSWRCKECHGWDYVGKDGRYSKGSHYTGIAGIYGSRTKTPSAIFASMTDAGANHDFSKYLNEGQIWSLVKFTREGLIDPKTVFKADGSVAGNAKNGKILYDRVCAQCHGADGKTMDFKKDKDDIQGVGFAAEDNPQEILHKIRWGHPGTNMPSTIIDSQFSDQDGVDLLSYAMTL